MRQTLFHISIDQELFGLPLFGVGLLLGVWAVAVAVMFIRWLRHGGDLWGNLVLMLPLGAAILLLPRLAEGQGLPVRGFGVMLLVALVCGLWLAIRRARQLGLDPEAIISLAFWMFISGIVGARLFYVVQKWDEFPHGSLAETAFALVNVTQGGLVVYGSVIAAGVALIYFCRRHGLPLLAVSDLIAPSLLVGLAMGRVGCFLNGCCYGGVCELPWAVTFPWRSPPHFRQVETGQIDLHGLYLSGAAGDPPVVRDVVTGSPAARQGIEQGDRLERINSLPVMTVKGAQFILLSSSGEVSVRVAGDPQVKRWKIATPLPRSLPVHPTQLYSTLDGLILALFLWSWYPFRRSDGEVTAWMLTLYPITRFLMESIRTDEPKNILGMTISQNISLLLFLTAVALWAHLWRNTPRLHFANVASPAAAGKRRALARV